MTRTLVLYHSIYGHVQAMAEAAGGGAAEVPGTTVDIKRVPETLDVDTLGSIGAKLDQHAPVAAPAELADYDAIIFGTGTRFGNMTGQMRSFLDQTGELWQRGALVSKVGSVIVASATQHGGQESTALSFHTTMLHHGMIVVGLPYTDQRQMDISQMNGGSPYGASTITGGAGERMPSEEELGMAHFQGRRVAEIAALLAAG